MKEAPTLEIRVYERFSVNPPKKASIKPVSPSPVFPTLLPMLLSEHLNDLQYFARPPSGILIYPSLYAAA